MTSALSLSDVLAELELLYREAAELLRALAHASPVERLERARRIERRLSALAWAMDAARRA